MTRRTRRRSSMWRVTLFSVLIMGLLYVNQVVVPYTPPLFLPTQTPTTSPESFVNQAVEMYNSGKLESAIDAYNSAVNADPTNPANYVELARIQVFAGRYDEAVVNTQNALLKNPDLPLAHAVLGWALGMQEKYSEAELEIQKALSQDPNNPLAHAYLAEIYTAQGIDDFALYEKASEESKIAMAADNTLLEVHRARGIVMLNTNNLNEAIEAFQTALAINRNIPDLHYYLGVAYRLNQQLDKAQESLLYSYSLNPKDTQALRELSAAFYADGRFAQASQYAEEAVKVDPTNARLHGYLGITYYKQEQFDKAIPELALAVHGGDAGEGQVVEGIPLSYDERVMEYYWFYGFALQKQNRCQEAAPIFQALLSGVPDNEIAVYNANEGIARCSNQSEMTEAPAEEEAAEESAAEEAEATPTP